MPQTATNRHGGPIDAESVFTLFGDDYVHELFEALEDGPATVDELTDRCRASRVTIYRRLNDLEELGFVRSRTKIRSDGNHCKVFRTVDRTVRITLSPDGVDVELEGDR
ncbi:winged helix-turn-helix domain-containing protein [Natronobeatus ordinarius]|uniref:winged helix-turn-helix domain-containing protein n=1 Tax=Natronobeatus ordinarius TaxID=2963433 RepID=UPI0020CC8B48|nr:winged helix-turn-helix domain-containing protein [Natronobeatus ordinarius]